MNKRNVLFACWLMALPALSLTTRAQTLSIGDAAPAMQVRQWLKGNPVNSFEKGKVYVVEFWATWCKPCIAGMPHLSELAAQYKSKVTIAGISILERAGTTIGTLDSFVAKMGNKMAYNIGAEDSNYMAKRWLNASGERGIPLAYVIDQQGRIAWIGLPRLLDTVLPKVIAGKWDIAAAAAGRKEDKRLTALDQAVIPQLNPFMGNPGKPKEALAAIEQILATNPGLKYYPMTGHFTFYSLVKTDPEQALVYGKEWFAHNSEPRFSTVTDAVTGKDNLPPALYAFAADCYQEQLDRYPWSMNFPVTYSNIAALQHKAGNKAKAIAAAQQAIAAAKKVPAFSPEELSKLEATLAELTH
jgi:thiol-disulfide isomerase/thioredoxin